MTGLTSILNSSTMPAVIGSAASVQPSSEVMFIKLRLEAIR